MNKIKVLIITPHYLPGFKAGGPIQSIKNIVENLSDRIIFKIATSDRDLGSKDTYKGIKYNSWEKSGKGLVKYFKFDDLYSLKEIIRLLRDEEYEILYLNSSFSTITIKILFLKKIGFLKNKKIIIAPRGEYSPGALELKRVKKFCFLKISKCIGLYKNIIWQATTKEEAELILKIQGSQSNVKIAENLKEIKKITKNLEKIPKKLKLIFASRISPKKNLINCLEILQDFDYKGIDFNIVGPIEDEEYWKKCQKIMKKLKNISVNYLGVQPNNQLIDTLSKHHFLFFPTLGENFGHIILESLIAKTPLIISDKTPWKNLEEKGIGWELELKNKFFIEILEKTYYMGELEYYRKVECIDQYIKSYDQKKAIENNLELFYLN